MVNTRIELNNTRAIGLEDYSTANLVRSGYLLAEAPIIRL